MFHDALGQTTYRDAIREKLMVVPKMATPITYKSLWEIGVSGILNLNLDRLATKALQEVRGPSASSEFSGFQAKNIAHVLKNPSQFIVNLHGISEDSSSWVLTPRQLKRLTADKGYKQFISACFLTRTIIFIGMSVDDVAVGGYLDRLGTTSLDSGSHYWITDRRDEKTHQWAENRQIRIIRYSSSGGNHSELNELFHDLKSYKPIDDAASPVVFHAQALRIESLDEPAELEKKDAESVREILNAQAQYLLQEDNKDSYNKYEQFCNKYD
jgi:hypothetical protein